MAPKFPSLLLVAMLVALSVSPSLSQFYGGDAEPNAAKYGGDADPYSAFAASGLDGDEGEDPFNIYCLGAKDRALCTWMVGKDTELMLDAIGNGIKATIRVAKQFETIMPVVTTMVAQLPQPARSKVVKVCVQSYSDTMTKLRASIVALHKPDIVGVVSLLNESFHTSCADAIKEQGLSMPAMNKYTTFFGKVIETAISVTQEND